MGRVVTVIPRQVREGQWLAAHSIREPLQEDVDSHRLCDLQVLIGWCLEHNSNLSVHISLREVGSAFPGSRAEHHGYVLWWGVGQGKDIARLREWDGPLSPYKFSLHPIKPVFQIIRLSREAVYRGASLQCHHAEP